MDNLVPIGRFSKICRLSVSSLRYYDEVGLLRPALVDPDSSYRYYRLSQVRVAETIRLLRALEMPLDEVRAYLCEGDSPVARELLNRHQRRMEERVEEGQRILTYLRRLQGAEDALDAADVRARQIEAQDVVSIHACVPEQEVSGTWRALASELKHFIDRAGQPAAGPIGAIFPDPVHRDEAVNVTVFIPICRPLPRPAASSRNGFQAGWQRRLPTTAHTPSSTAPTASLSVGCSNMATKWPARPARSIASAQLRSKTPTATKPRSSGPWRRAPLLTLKRHEASDCA